MIGHQDRKFAIAPHLAGEAVGGEREVGAPLLGQLRQPLGIAVAPDPAGRRSDGEQEQDDDQPTGAKERQHGKVIASRRPDWPDKACGAV